MDWLSFSADGANGKSIEIKGIQGLQEMIFTLITALIWSRSLSVLAVFTTYVFRVDAVHQVSVRIEQLDGTNTITTVPEAVVASGAVGRFVIDKEHIFFLTGDIRDHAAGRAALLDMPDDLRFGLPTVEIRMDEGPCLGEIEFVRRPLIPESRQEFARKGQRTDFRPPATDVEHTVRQFLTGDFTGKVVRRQPNPG